MKRQELFACAVIIALSLLFMAGAAKISAGSKLEVTSPGAYPLFVSCLCLLCALWVTISTLKKKQEEHRDCEWPLFSCDLLCFVGIIFLYFLGIQFMHYTVATLLFLSLGIWFLAKRDWKKSLLIAFVCTFWILLIFKYALSVIMP